MALYRVAHKRGRWVKIAHQLLPERCSECGYLHDVVLRHQDTGERVEVCPVDVLCLVVDVTPPDRYL